MKRSDMVFLTHLRQDARQTLTTISRKTKIPISTLYDKLRQHRQSLIVKHTTLIDFARLGYNCRANVMLSVNKEEREKVRSFLTEQGCVNSIYKINNGFDFMIEVVCETVKHLEDFIELLESRFAISEKRVFHVIEDVKRESFLSKLDHLDLLPGM